MFIIPEAHSNCLYSNLFPPEFVRKMIIDLQNISSEEEVKSSSEEEVVIEEEPKSKPRSVVSLLPPLPSPSPVTKVHKNAPPPQQKKRRMSESKRRSTSPVTKRVRHSLPPKTFIDPPNQVNLYDLAVRELYTGPKFIGKFNIPIQYLRPASLRPDLVTRQISPSHLKTVKNSLASFPSGLETRCNFKLAVVNRNDCVLSDQVIRDRLKVLKDLDDAHLAEALYQLGVDGVILLTVGGNHSRQAIMELANEGKAGFLHNTQVSCDVFHDLTQTEITALGVVDNIVSSAAEDLGLHEKVDLIRRMWKDSSCTELKRTKLWLNSEAENNAVFGILHTNDSIDRVKRARQANPFLRACNVPDIHWDIVFELLRDKVLKQESFRSILWTLPEEDLARLLQNLKDSSDLKAFKNGLDASKSYDRIIVGIQSLAKLGKYQKLSSDTNLLIKFDKICPITKLVNLFREELKKSSKGAAVFQHEDFTKTVNKVFDKLLVGQAEEDSSSDDVTVLVKADAMESIHRFTIGNGLDALSVVQKPGIIFVDPPFGVHGEDHAWDTLFDEEWWTKFFTDAGEKHKDVPIVLFCTEQMMHDLIMQAKVLGYVHCKVYHWLRTGVMGNYFGRSSYPCCPILVFTRVPLKYYTQDANSNFVNGNFVATSRPKWFFGDDGKILNETQKPVELFRFFIAVFGHSRLCVLDVCSGSGSGAIAASTLGRDSYSYDIRPTQIDGSVRRIREFAEKPYRFMVPTRICLYAMLDKDLKVSAAKALDPGTFIPKEKEKRPRRISASQPTPAKAVVPPEPTSVSDDETMEEDAAEDYDFAAEKIEEADAEMTARDIEHSSPRSEESVPSPNTAAQDQAFVELDPLAVFEDVDFDPDEV